MVLPISVPEFQTIPLDACRSRSRENEITQFLRAFNGTCRRAPPILRPNERGRVAHPREKRIHPTVAKPPPVKHTRPLRYLFFFPLSFDPFSPISFTQDIVAVIGVCSNVGLSFALLSVIQHVNVKRRHRKPCSFRVF